VAEHARAVVIGGGIVGTSVAYHLTRLGWREVVLLERKSLTCGTTWHAAGLIGRLRGSRTMATLVRYSAELYARLEAETGVSTNWRECGSLYVTNRPERLTQFRRAAALGAYVDIEAQVVSPAAVGRRWPLARVDDAVGGMWIPGDGRVIPADVTQALAAGARAGGAKIREDAPVRAVLVRDGAVVGVRTDAGEIAADVVVNCAGLWARELGLQNGVTIPLYACEHFYAVTRPMAGVTPDLPVLRDLDRRVYIREEVGGILIGGFERAAKPWPAADGNGGAGAIPPDFAFGQLKDDWDHFEPLMRGGVERIPALADAEIQILLNGPESFTPDGGYILGEAPGLHGYFIAAGFNSGGIANAGGAGKVLAEWIVGGHMPIDLWSIDPRRFAPLHNTTAFLTERMTEVVGLHYRMAWPNRQPESGRGLLRSPLYGRLAARGAVFGAKMGWERAHFFAPDEREPALRYTFGRPDWLPRVAREHRAAREACAIFDQSSFSKLMVTGPDAQRELSRLAAGDVAAPAGRAVYTPMLNERGGYESDLTISRLAPDRYLLVTGTAQRVRDADWIGRNVRPGSRLAVADVTDEYATLTLAGPRARDVLARATKADLGNAAFPYGEVREIEVAGARAWALRIGYAGELGWELYVRSDAAPAVYDALTARGDVTDAGYYALDALRLEKGYRAWGNELTPDDTPLEAGLGFAVKMDKPGGFIGREALLAQRARGLTRRLLLFALEEVEGDGVMAWGEEPIYRDDRCVGILTSAGFGHTVGRVLGMGYVPVATGETTEQLLAARWSVDVAGRHVPARAAVRAWHDPAGERLRA